jgi:two-component system phosphate regulon sensor histidine kinase PhoR
MENLTQVVLRLADGHTDLRAETLVGGPAEVLSRAVNRLADALEDTQARLQQASENLEALLAHTEEFVVATDQEDRIALINPAAVRLLERPQSELLAQPFSSIFPQREVQDIYRRAFSSPTPVLRQLRLPFPRRVIECAVTATTMYRGPSYRGTLVLIRDLTEINKAFQMKTDFVANASHELRTPLASIRAAVETINGSEPDDRATIKRCVDIIGGHVLRLQMLVQDLLDLSHTEDPRAVVRADRVDLEHVCAMVVGMYAPLAAEKQILLQVQLAEDAREARGDERLLVLSLKNLVDNALKFTPAGGRVTMRSSLATRASDWALVLSVQDTGCGIPVDEQQRVFERFYTVNRSRGGADRGTGLGLAIVKHALSAMGGVVQLESTPGEGTTVRCILPATHVVREDAAALQPEA